MTPVQENPFTRPERTRIQRAVAIVAGWICLLLAVAGWILPFVPGWVLFVAGLLILSSEYLWAHKLVEKARKRFPTLVRALDRKLARAQNRVGIL